MMTKVLPNAFALFKVRLCMTLAPKKDQLSRNAEALFLNDRPFCLLGYKRKQQQKILNANKSQN